MKDKPPSKAKRIEWEEFLKKNKQLPIYMGDHMTRTWTKSEKDIPNEVEVRKNSHGPKSPVVATDPLGSKGIASSRSQFSVRKISNGRRRMKTAKEILLHHSITLEELQSWEESFDSLLASTTGRYIFKIFLESEIADENLKFWLACEELKQATQQKKLEKKVQEIYNTFINVYSPQEINIDYKMRECIVEQLKYKTDISVFTEAQHQVYTLMHRDSYPRFLLSSIIEDLRRLLTERRSTNTETRSIKKPEENTPRPSGGLIACCYCRRHSSDQDIAAFVKEQNTATTSAVNKSPGTPSDNQDLNSQQAPKTEPPNPKGHETHFPNSVARQSISDDVFVSDPVNSKTESEQERSAMGQDSSKELYLPEKRENHVTTLVDN